MHKFRWTIASMGLFLVLAVGAVAPAAVKLPSIFSDHVVLQRQMPLTIWGWADAGEKVTVELAGKSATTQAGDDGRWRVELPAMEAGGPHTLTVKGSNTLTVNDVLVGEVWLCSGQSNMEWPVSRSANAKKEIAAANHPKIRHFKVPHIARATPQADVPGKWAVCSPNTVGGFTAVGYYMARKLQQALDVPIGLIGSNWGGTRIEPWTPPVGFESVEALSDIAERVRKQAVDAKPNDKVKHQDPTMLYNGMIHGIVGYPMRGAIWYQGESNHREGMLYAHKKRALVEGWRTLWNIGEFPFYFVQIAPYQYGNEDPHVLPRFWEAQAHAAEHIPHTGMVVINDIATLNDIHPPNKQDVGLRLANMALKRNYGFEKIVATGPTPQSITPTGDKLRVSFAHTAGGLKSRDGKPLTHFEVAGDGSGWHDAEATIDGDSVVLHAPKVDKPQAVRFAWHKLAEPNLINGAGLPTGAFRAGDPGKPDAAAHIDELDDYQLALDLDLHLHRRVVHAQTPAGVRAGEVTQ